MRYFKSVSRVALVVCFTVVLFTTAIVSAGAWPGTSDWVLHEDVRYCVYNPASQTYYSTTDWTAIPESDVPLVKIQQTVYSQDLTAQLKSRSEIPSYVTGYLYTYSVSNLNVFEKVQDTYYGIHEIQMDWPLKPNYVATSDQTAYGWKSYIDSTSRGWQCEWKWESTGPGLMPGETVGGLWAFSSSDKSYYETAKIEGGLNDSVVIWANGLLVTPEPGGLIALLTGLVGIFGYAARLRR